MDLALEYADRVIGIRKGQIVYDGAASEVTQDVLDTIYLEDTTNAKES